MSASYPQTSSAESRLPTIAVSVGELFDKKTILQIKVQKLATPQQRANASKELEILAAASDALSNECSEPDALRALEEELLGVNTHLWDLENKVRQLSRDGETGTAFVVAAQQIFSGNDERARTKRAINKLMNSLLIEEKSHD